MTTMFKISEKQWNKLCDFQQKLDRLHSIAFDKQTFSKDLIDNDNPILREQAKKFLLDKGLVLPYLNGYKYNPHMSNELRHMVHRTFVLTLNPCGQ